MPLGPRAIERTRVGYRISTYHGGPTKGGFDDDDIFDDILTLLDADHRTIEGLFIKFESSDPSDRESLFCELVHTLVAHEVAEEAVVYPAIQADAPESEFLIERLINEQKEVEGARGQGEVRSRWSGLQRAPGRTQVLP